MSILNQEDLLPFYRKNSYEEKFADNAKWIELCVDSIDKNMGYSDIAYHTKLDVNYSIIKNKSGSAVYQDLIKSRQIIDPSITNKKQHRKNYDILSPIYKSMVGEQQKRELFAICKDISGYNQSLYKKKKLDLYTGYVKSNIHAPLQQQATQEILLKHQIQDPKQLKPEEQDQISFEIEELMKFKTPKDIDKFMTDDYKSPTETQLQEILNWVISEFNIKFITDEAFKHFIPSGRSICYTNIENFKPVVKIINPRGFRYVAKDNSYFISEGEQWMNEEFITYGELLSSIPHDSNIEKVLQDSFSSFAYGDRGDHRRYITGEMPSNILTGIADYDSQHDNYITRSLSNNLATNDGQGYLSYLYSKFGNTSLFNNKIRKVNICYTAYSKGYHVQRYNKSSDTMQYYWVGENYETNKELDVNVTEYWFPEYYQADKIGYDSSLIYNKKRVEFQNRSVNNPWDITPPYDGIEYARLFNNTSLVAPLDYGKAYQEEFNDVKEKIEELDKTNIGRIFALPESFIPTDWSLEKFVAFIKEHKIAVINENNSSINPAIASQILKSIDATNNNDIIGYINRLSSIRSEAEIAMSYSPSSLGQAPASITATTNQQNVIQSSYKTEDIFSLHSMFINRLLTNAVLMVRNALTKNDELKQALLSIPSLAALDIDTNLLIDSVPFIDIINRTNEVKAVNDVKDLLQPMIQNQIISKISDVMKLQFKNNPAEMLNVAENAERQIEQQRQETIKLEQENLEKDRRSREMMDDKRLEFEKYKFDREQETKRYISDNDAAKFERQMDADNNDVPDSVQVALINRDKELEKERIRSGEVVNKAANDVKIAKINAERKNTS